MAIKTTNELKQMFSPRPTAQDFADLIDTFDGLYQMLEGGLKGITPGDVLPVPTENTIYIAMMAGTYSNLLLANGSPAPSILVNPGDVDPLGNYDRTEIRYNKITDGWEKVLVEKKKGNKFFLYEEIEASPIPEKTQFIFKKSNAIYRVLDGQTLGIGEDPSTSEKTMKIGGLISIVKETYVELQADLNYVANSLAMVINDPNPYYNGIFVKTGDIDMGEWSRAAFANPVFSKPNLESIAIGGGHMSMWKNPDEPGTGFAHTALGFEAGKNIGNCWATTLIGYKAGRSLSNASVSNTFSPGIGNTGNTFVGYNVGSVANGALDNTFVGTSAGENLTTGMDNCGFGIWSLRVMQAGGENACFGHATGMYLVGIGTAADIDNLETNPESPNYSWGHRNTMIGDQAGRLNSGNNAHQYCKKCVYVGAKTRASGDYVVNENAFGYGATGRGSDTLVLGNYDVKETSFHGILRNWTDRRFADLPAPDRQLVGARSFILDASTRTFDQVVSGGGVHAMPVWCDGSSWRVG